MSKLKPCPFCGSLAVVKCRVDSDWGVDLKYRLLNDESNYDIKSMIADENYDPDYQTGDYWGIEIYRCQSCRAEWGVGTDVCIAELEARIAELEAAHRWRVVADGELPNKNDYYLARDDLGQQGMILFYDGEWNKFTNLSYITHWMPLPELPEVRE